MIQRLLLWIGLLAIVVGQTPQCDLTCLLTGKTFYGVSTEPAVCPMAEGVHKDCCAKKTAHLAKHASCFIKEVRQAPAGLTESLTLPLFAIILPAPLPITLQAISAPGGSRAPPQVRLALKRVPLANGLRAPPALV